MTNTEVSKKHLENFLKENGFSYDNLPYPNVISIRGVNIKVVCPDTKNPKYLAINANKKPADFYVGYIFNEHIGRLVGFVDHNNLTYFPEAPDFGWRDPTYRIPIEHLQPIHMLFEALKSLTNNYV